MEALLILGAVVGLAFLTRNRLAPDDPAKTPHAPMQSQKAAMAQKPEEQTAPVAANFAGQSNSVTRETVPQTGAPRFNTFERATKAVTISQTSVKVAQGVANTKPVTVKSTVTPTAPALSGGPIRFGRLT